MDRRDTTPKAVAAQTAVQRRVGGRRRFRVAVEISDLICGWRQTATGWSQVATMRAPARADATSLHPESRMSVEGVFARVRGRWWLPTSRTC